MEQPGKLSAGKIIFYKVRKNEFFYLLYIGLISCVSGRDRYIIPFNGGNRTKLVSNRVILMQ